MLRTQLEGTQGQEGNYNNVSEKCFHCRVLQLSGKTGEESRRGLYSGEQILYGKGLSLDSGIGFN